MYKVQKIVRKWKVLFNLHMIMGSQTHPAVFGSIKRLYPIKSENNNFVVGEKVMGMYNQHPFYTKQSFVIKNIYGLHAGNLCDKKEKLCWFVGNSDVHPDWSQAQHVGNRMHMQERSAQMVQQETIADGGEAVRFFILLRQRIFVTCLVLVRIRLHMLRIRCNVHVASGGDYLEDGTYNNRSG